MGAGAAVYVIGGGLVIEGSTFEGNAALGGVAAGAVINNGAYGINGGGGGVVGTVVRVTVCHAVVAVAAALAATEALTRKNSVAAGRYSHECGGSLRWLCLRWRWASGGLRFVGPM
jgi:hypothetical protein